MVIVIAIAAFPIGFLLRNRVAAFLAFGLAFSHVFTFQTAQLDPGGDPRLRRGLRRPLRPWLGLVR